MFCTLFLSIQDLSNFSILLRDVLHKKKKSSKRHPSKNQVHKSKSIYIFLNVFVIKCCQYVLVIIIDYRYISRSPCSISYPLCWGIIHSRNTLIWPLFLYSTGVDTLGPPSLVTSMCPRLRGSIRFWFCFALTSKCINHCEFCTFLKGIFQRPKHIIRKRHRYNCI